MEQIAQMLKYQGEWAEIYHRQRRQRLNQQKMDNKIKNLKAKVVKQGVI